MVYIYSESIPQKLKQNRPKKTLFYFSVVTTIRAPKIVEAKVSQKQANSGFELHNSCPDFGLLGCINLESLFNRFGLLFFPSVVSYCF